MCVYMCKCMYFHTHTHIYTYIDIIQTSEAKRALKSSLNYVTIIDLSIRHFHDAASINYIDLYFIQNSVIYNFIQV